MLMSKGAKEKYLLLGILIERIFLNRGTEYGVLPELRVTEPPKTLRSISYSLRSIPIPEDYSQTNKDTLY